MKKLLTILVLAMSSSAFSQLSIDFSKEGSSFSLDFNSGYVCKAEPSFSEAPTLGYGVSEALAKADAINNCMVETGNNRMHCDDVECDPISFNNGRPTISVSKKGGKLGVYFSTGSAYTCIVDASFGRGLFVAEAPTKLEAEVYAQRVCMGQTGNARMHCNDMEPCEKISGVDVGVEGSDDIVNDAIDGIKDIFKKRKKKKKN